MREFNRSELVKMVRRYVSGTATEQEAKFVEEYYNHFENRDDIFNELPEEARLQIKAEQYGKAEGIMDETVQHSRSMWSAPARFAAAASVMIILATSLYFFKQAPDKKQVEVAQKPGPTIHDIAPGGNKALLTLADGSKIILDDAANGEIAQQAGINISKRADGQLIYTIEKAGEDGKNLYNTIETPKGGEYQINLPDGTRVWLNAASSLRFPAAFAGNSRQVELDGEAYFEVAASKGRPFKVKSTRQVVEVLGTHFNVSSYGDELASTTTLLEGSVKVSGNSGNYRMLKPGQQSAITTAGEAISVKEIDAEEAIAWKNGYFIFTNENIETIMRKVSRWYNVDVEYRGDIPTASLGGTVSKTKNISEVLEVLELTKIIHFKLEGRRVIVMP